MNILIGSKIRLRLLHESDAEFLYTNVSDPEVKKQLRQLPDPLTIEHEYEFIRKVNAEAQTGESSHFGIELIETGEITGMIGALYPEGNYEFAEIGYWIAKKYWNRGIATEAIKMIITFLHETRKVKKVTANVFENNKGSVRALEKNGFWRAGLAKEQYCNKINTAPILKFEKFFSCFASLR